MKESAKYAKIVEWSDEDQCYVGSAPGLIFGGCHGEDEKKVFNELCHIVEQAIDIYHKDVNHCRRQPPDATSRLKCRMLHDHHLSYDDVKPFAMTQNQSLPVKHSTFTSQPSQCHSRNVIDIGSSMAIKHYKTYSV